MDEMIINEGECHTITFQSSRIQANFRQLLYDYFNKKASEECNYIKILNDRGDKINGRDFYFIQFNCNSIYLKEERNTEKQIREILQHYLEYNPDLLKDFIEFNDEMNHFFSQIEIVKDHLTIDFQPTDKTMTQLIRSLEVNIEYRERGYVPNHIIRDFLINALLDMNVLKKQVVLLISYPEADIGMKDFVNAINLLKKLDVTTLIVTSHRDIITSVAVENMFLVNENGSLYDIITLQKELLQLKDIDQEKASKVAKILAFQDFKQDYCLLDKEMKEFLLSNRI